ncbi:hypothetical protein K432DRAFT_457409 [Lepidopterella palustris CBS 459.81]|uniref:Uncharacterized protein n=1 Tax=Lepidopterella palustris CBS 459.81 TaxID=1314670 RepID=A0A8E2JDN9_9PEZI|nr:hypothetical protein K432DRAFT_457409 [Lepidopterella palustris CBS 459.81]
MGNLPARYATQMYQTEPAPETLFTLPKAFDDTYSCIFSNINPDYSLNTYSILLWSWHCFGRPITILEIAKVLAVDLEASPRYDPQQ